MTIRSWLLRTRPWASIFAVIGLLSPAVARSLNTGDIVVADERGSGLIFVDRLTGAQHTLASSLPAGQGFADVTTNASGEVFAIAAAAGEIYKIDTINGGHTLIASGGNLQFPFTIDWAPDGKLYVTEPSVLGGLIQVDSNTGAQNLIVSGLVQGFAVDAANVGYIALADASAAPAFHLYRVNLSTGETVKVSNTGIRAPSSILVEPTGNLIVVDVGGGGVPFGVFRVNPSTGVFTTLAAGPPLMNPWGAALEADGTVIIVDHQKLQSCNPPPPRPVTCPGALYRVSSSSGAQTLVTEKDLFHDIAGADIYRGPSVPTPTRRSSWGRVKTLYR